jgi:hypothetical protein
VRLGALGGKLDRWAGEFNRWFGGPALANSVADSGGARADHPQSTPRPSSRFSEKSKTNADPEEDR